MFTTTETKMEYTTVGAIENMVAVETAFRDAYDHTLSHFPDVKRREIITKFVSGITMQYSMYMAFTSDGLQQLMQNVFSNEIMRDFVFRLTMAFQARLGHTSQGYSDLITTLTNSMCVLESASGDVDRQGTVAIPEEIAARLPSHDDIQLLLSANKWIVTIAMISLYVRVEVEIPKRQTKE